MPIMPAKSLTLQRTLAAPAAQVYPAFTNSTRLREWLSDSALAAPQKGGRLYLAWNDGYFASGRFQQLQPEKKITFTWHGSGEPAPTRVAVTLKEKKGATTVTVTHSGFGGGARWGTALRDLTRAWELSLENLQSVLETGADLRLTQRPLLGITIDTEINAENAAKFGLPVTAGVRLGGVVTGLGAHAAGLQAGDVLVGIGGKRVSNWPSLGVALQGRRAGQTVPVSYYRGGAKQTASMTLSGRPQPAIPPTAAALAEAVRQQYADFDAQLAAVFAGATEAQAAARPAPEEWSAKEVVAHLLIGERDQHAWITELIAAAERSYDGFLDNSLLRTRVVAQTYPTIAALLTELQRMEAETVALLAGLPDEVVARKSTYWRLAYNWLQGPSHTGEHLPQIQAALEAARSHTPGHKPDPASQGETPMSLLKGITVVSVFITKANWDKAKQFYSETLELGAPTLAADDFGWVQFGDGEHKSALALSRWDDAAPPPRDGATVVFAVDDAHAVVAELRRRGVKCEDPVPVPGMVTYANFFDLEGNRLQVAGRPPQG